MRLRQQNDANHPIVFLMVTASNHINGATGETVSVTLSKNGGAFGAAAGAVSELGSGWYALAANATDRNTLGSLAIHATSTNADPTDLEYCIVAYDPFDVAALGLTNLDAKISTRATSADVTVSLAVSSTVAAAVSSGSLGMSAYYTFAQTITSTIANDLSAATKLWLAIKTSPSDADTAALVFVEKTAGLTVINGAAYSTPADGTLTVTGSSGAWNVAIWLNEAATGGLIGLAGYYPAELKALIGGDTFLVWSGDCILSDGVVRAIA